MKQIPERITLYEGRRGDPSVAKSSTLHEVQHSIQDREGFAKGGSPSNAYQSGELDAVTARIYERIKELPGNKSETKESLYKHAKKLANSEQGRMENYRRLAGEAEARNVQTRMDYTPEQRRATPPWDTLDVPEDELIVRMGGDGQSMSAGPVPNLPMDEASRLARANDMGFNPEQKWYHGTPDNRGINEDGFSTAKERYNDSAKEGPYFFTDNRRVANTYADDARAMDYQNADPEVITAVVKKGNPLDIDAQGAQFRGVSLDAMKKAMTQEEVAKLDEIMPKLYHHVDADNGTISTDGLSQIAKFLGKDSVLVRNVRDDYTGEGPTSNVLAVFGANNIRRPSAKFDPANKDSANIMSGGLAAALGLGLSNNQGMEE